MKEIVLVILAVVGVVILGYSMYDEYRKNN